jgi:glyoxylase-like metal-dependent hydrolase (beta-lactamase superfamily II)
MDRIQSGTVMDELMDFARLNGFPERELLEIAHTHPGFKFRAKGPLSFHILKEGDILRISDYVFHCLETPGHSKGHMCLYEPNKKILVAGDHILRDITPTISLLDDDWDPLKNYLESLDKVYQLDIELVLPGHREVFKDAKERIQELKNHHAKRLDEIIAILRKGRKNAFQVASQMTWDIVYDSWDLFPVSQKWFATGEAISHLKYLEEKGIVRKETQQHKRIYVLDP